MNRFRSKTHDRYDEEDDVREVFNLTSLYSCEASTDELVANEEEQFELVETL